MGVPCSLATILVGRCWFGAALDRANRRAPRSRRGCLAVPRHCGLGLGPHRWCPGITLHVWSSVQRAGCFQLYIGGNTAGKRQSRRVWKCRVQSACSEVSPMAGPNNIRCVLGEAIACCAADAGWPVSRARAGATSSVKRTHPHTLQAGDHASYWCRRGEDWKLRDGSPWPAIAPKSHHGGHCARTTPASQRGVVPV